MNEGKVKEKGEEKKKKASRTLAFPVKDGSGIMNLFVNFLSLRKFNNKKLFLASAISAC